MSEPSGAWLPSEKRVGRDARTGVAVWQLTDAPCINHAPYFLNPAWAGEQRNLLVLTSYRGGGPDLYAVRLPDGALRRLTDSGDVRPWSACVAPDGRRVYYGAGGELRAVDLGALQAGSAAAGEGRAGDVTRPAGAGASSGGRSDGADAGALRPEVVATIPHGAAADACSISSDGTEIAASSFDPEGYGTGRHALLAIDTRTGGVRVLHEMDQLIVHAQYSPDGSQVLFAGELPRLWLVDRDGRNAHPLRGQTRQEWLVHEAWLNDEEIIFVHWPHALKAIRRDGTGERTISPVSGTGRGQAGERPIGRSRAFDPAPTAGQGSAGGALPSGHLLGSVAAGPPSFNCWHPAPSANGRLIVCDTNVPDVGLQLIDPATGAWRTLCYPEASCRGTRWTSPTPIWEGPVKEADYGPQWTHPHPSFTPDGRGVVFTSDRTGYPQVYVAWLEPGTGAGR